MGNDGFQWLAFLALPRELWRTGPVCSPRVGKPVLWASIHWQQAQVEAVRGQQAGTGSKSFTQHPTWESQGCRSCWSCTACRWWPEELSQKIHLHGVLRPELHRGNGMNGRKQVPMNRPWCRLSQSRLEYPKVSMKVEGREAAPDTLTYPFPSEDCNGKWSDGLGFCICTYFAFSWFSFSLLSWSILQTTWEHKPHPLKLPFLLKHPV